MTDRIVIDRSRNWRTALPRRWSRGRVRLRPRPGGSTRRRWKQGPEHDDGGPRGGAVRAPAQASTAEGAVR